MALGIVLLMGLPTARAQALLNVFSHPKAVHDLLRGFVHEDDIIWRLRMQATQVPSGQEQNGQADSGQAPPGEWVNAYLQLGFQSGVDAFMAVRLLTYFGLLYQLTIHKLIHSPPEHENRVWVHHVRWHAGA